MKKNTLTLIVSVVFILVASGCGLPSTIANKFEKGEITFVNPAADGTSIFHNYDVAVLPVEITLNSTFESPKMARISVDGVPWIDCPLEGLGRNTSCPTANIQTNGVHTISAEVQKLDGTLVSAQTSVTWTPYSPLEQSMEKVAGMFGQEDPRWGFNIVGFGLALAVTCFLLYVTQGSKFGTIAITVVMVITFFIIAPVEVTSLFIESAGGIVSFYVLYMIFTSLHFFHVNRRPDGSTSLTYLGSGGEKGGRITDSVGRTATKVLPPPQNQLYAPYDPDDYIDANGIQHTTIRPKGFFQRLLGG